MTPWSNGYACDSDEAVIFNTEARTPSESASELIFFYLSLFSFFMNFKLFIDYKSYLSLYI